VKQYRNTYEADVVVFGAGPAGIAAALANKSACNLQELNTKQVVEKLISLGVNGIGNQTL
jgi:ribulose 1,5-bisphosphate synthetase/thiazole synthase